jgi:hypothetical protein
MKYSITIILLFFVSTVFAQNENRSSKLVQFSGMITDADSNAVVPYVTITNLSYKEQKHNANYQGYFSFVARAGDSILFSAVGFTSKMVVLPNEIEDRKYTAKIQLKSEIVYLQTVRVYPWATVEEFTKEFLTMKVADDDMAIAKKNLSPKSIRGMTLSMTRDAQEIANGNYRNNFDRMVNVNMRQMNPFLNPLAWGKLMQTIFNGDQLRTAEK